MVLGPPDKHKDIVREINKWQYDIEGSKFKGKQAPAIHEIRFYEVRLPEELEEKFSRDMALNNIYDFNFGTAKSFKTKVFRFLAKVFLKFTPYSPIKKAPGKQQYAIQAWHYALAFGKIKRNKINTKGGKEREVL